MLIVGSNLRREAPVLAHRVQKAAERGARIAFLNPARYDYLFPVAGYLESSPAKQLGDLAAIYSAVLDGATDSQAPKHLARLVADAQVNTAHRAIAAALKSGAKRAVWLGALALRHSAYADLRALAAGIAAATGATLGTLAEGGNAAGAYLAGAVPHRDAGGIKSAAAGKSARDMLSAPQKAYLLFGGAEPWADGSGPDARTRSRRRVVHGCGHSVGRRDTQVRGTCAVADLHICGDFGHLRKPRRPVAELAGAARPLGEVRPGWKVLRVLGNLAGVADFDSQSSEEVREELRSRCADIVATSYQGTREASLSKSGAGAAEARVVDVPMYSIDAVLRRAPSLQRTREGKLAPLGLRSPGRMSFFDTPGTS